MNREAGIDLSPCVFSEVVLVRCLAVVQTDATQCHSKTTGSWGKVSGHFLQMASSRSYCVVKSMQMGLPKPSAIIPATWTVKHTTFGHILP